ncbi:MAG TPA: hypothetical protein VFS71_05550, partial [Flavobacterium sp.]|nr:hypothetical protein [Flavobacterium sp.]
MKKTLLLFLIFSGFQINANCFKTVADEYNHAVGVETDGTLSVWSGNSVGEFGDEINTDKNVSTLLDDSGALIATYTIQQIRCNGMADGSATVSPSGGTAPYTYLWSNGKTTATITGLAPGNYSCTVTDAASSSIILTVTITQPTSLFCTVTATNIDCHSNGSINVTATGGTPSYQYSVSPSAVIYQASNVFENIPAGNYQVTVRDTNGCLFMTTVVLASINTPLPTATAQNLNNTSTVANLLASGSDIKWYNVVTGGIPLDLSTTLQTGTYYASQTINGCESTRTAVDVTINNLYTLIPDVNFENKLIALGIDSGVADGKVLTANVDKLTSLNVSSSSISDLTGI